MINCLQGCSYILTERFIYYSVSKKDCDVYASGVKTVDNSITFTINYEGGKIAAQINCLGEHNVKNALAAFCVGLALDIPPEDIVKGIAQFKPEGLRQNVTVIGRSYII